MDRKSVIRYLSAFLPACSIVNDLRSVSFWFEEAVRCVRYDSKLFWFMT